MKYRPLTLGFAALLLVLLFAACTPEAEFPLPEPDYNAKLSRNFDAFDDALAAFLPERAAELDALLSGKTVLDIQGLLDDSQLTSEELVLYYIDRIQRYDVDKLNSVMALNPEVLDIAQRLVAERTESGARGQMHGNPYCSKTISPPVTRCRLQPGLTSCRTGRRTGMLSW